MRPLGVPLRRGKAMRIRDALRAHIDASKPTPSLSRGIRETYAVDGDEGRAAMPRVCEEAARGAYLKPCFRAGGGANMHAFLASNPPTLENAEAVFEAYRAADAEEGFPAWAAALDRATAASA